MKLADFFKRHVLFVSNRNDAASKMAEAFLNRLGEEWFYAESAGWNTAPLNSHAVRAMKEVGYDISRCQHQDVCTCIKMERMYHIIVIMGEWEEERPFPFACAELDWPLKDLPYEAGPEEECMKRARLLRDAIQENVEAFIHAYKGLPIKPMNHECFLDSIRH